MVVADAWEIRTVGEDCSDLLALRSQWHPGAGPDFEATFRDWWARERQHRHAVVAHVSGLPVGMANGQVFTRMPSAGHPRAQWLYAANIFVREQHRRRGIGRALVEALVAYARGSGMVRVVLAPSEESVALYASLGFRAAHDLMLLDLSG